MNNTLNKSVQARFGTKTLYAFKICQLMNWKIIYERSIESRARPLTTILFGCMSTYYRLACRHIIDYLAHCTVQTNTNVKKLKAPKVKRLLMVLLRRLWGYQSTVISTLKGSPVLFVKTGRKLIANWPNFELITRPWQQLFVLTLLKVNDLLQYKRVHEKLTSYR